MSTLRLTTLSNQGGTASVPSDTVINGTAKAWVNFNGTGTVAIRAAFNVSSITDLGTGIYIVNFTTAMPDANYSVATKAGNINSGGNYFTEGYQSSTTSSVRIVVFRGDSWALFDRDSVSVQIFR
jgi:hypothetical protein